MVSWTLEHDLGTVSWTWGWCLGVVSWSQGCVLGQKTVSQTWGQCLGSALAWRMVSLVGDNALDLGTCLGLGDGVLGQGMGSWTRECYLGMGDGALG